MKRFVEIEINVPPVASAEKINLPPELSPVADALLTRLEYLKDLRRARESANDQLRTAGFYLTPAQLDAFLRGGELP